VRRLFTSTRASFFRNQYFARKKAMKRVLLAAVLALLTAHDARSLLSRAGRSSGATKFFTRIG